MSKMWRGSWTLAAVVALIGVAGCNNQGGANEPAAPTTPLYERLGGEKAIKAVVDQVVTLAVNDPKVNFTRKGTSMEFKPTPETMDTLKKHLVQYLCHLSGGPQMYQGKDMKQAHKGMAITNAQFDAFAVDLGRALDKCKVGSQESEELLTKVEMTRPDIVEKK